MKIQHIFLMFQLIMLFVVSTAEVDEDIFTDYCKPGLCEYTGGDGAHSGCKGGIRHNGKLQSSCPADAAIIPLTDSDKQDILDFHNEQRNFVACGGLYKEYGLGPGCRHGVVTWDDELEKTAFLHTSYCMFAHDKCRGTEKYPFSGQNLGLITYTKAPRNTTFYINAITYLWYVEHYYTKMNMINRLYPQDKWMVGHFLTIINERNNRVGCTCAKFFDNKRQHHIVMLSCNYPTTNIVDTAVYNSCKKPSSKCSTGRDPKYKFLCSSKEKYNVEGLLDHIPYDGDGSEVFKCGRKVEFYHYDREGADVIKMLHKNSYPDKPIPIKQAATKKPVVTTTKQPKVQKPSGKVFKKYYKSTNVKKT